MANLTIGGVQNLVLELETRPRLKGSGVHVKVYSA